MIFIQFPYYARGESTSRDMKRMRSLALRH